MELPYVFWVLVKHVTLNFPDEFLLELREYCAWNDMKMNAVLMRAFRAMTTVSPVESAGHDALVQSGRMKPATRPGERVVELDKDHR